MKFLIEYSEEKNLLLKATRKIGFEDVLEAIEKDNILADLKHFKKTNQKVLVVRINSYAFAVPYVIDSKRSRLFLKTVYPSRVLTKRYIKKGGNI